MASKRRKLFLLSAESDILGAKLPSNQQVLGHFLHRHLELKKPIRTAATTTVKKVEEFWNRARIPTKHSQDIIKKVEKLFAEWQSLKKNANRRSKTQISNEEMFTSDFNDLFDIAHADALNLIKIPEDQEFLLAQREKGRHGSMISKDKVLEANEKAQEIKKAKEQLRKKKSEACVAILDKNIVLESSSSDFSAEEDSGSEEAAAGCSFEPSSHPKRGRKQVITKELAATLDRSGMSD